jgi:hypothetical protein
MARYAVTARIDRVQPHIARRDGPRSPDQRRAIDHPRPQARRREGRGSPRWERVRELWAQTTFYLFDPDSWR